MSNAEFQGVVQGLVCGVRADGRELTDIRDVEVLVGTVESAHGSSRVLCGLVDVVVAIKTEVSTPEPQTPKQGGIHFSVDHAGVCLSESKEHLLSFLSGAFRQNSQFLESLCIVPGKYCWHIHFDCVVFGADGPILPFLGLGIKAAAENSSLPALKLIGEPSVKSSLETDFSDVEFEVDQTEACTAFHEKMEFPLCFSVARIAEFLVLDPSASEEKAASMLLHIACDASGNIKKLLKTGPGTFVIGTLKEAIRVRLSFFMETDMEQIVSEMACDQMSVDSES